MSDIVERLRLTADWLDQPPPRSDPPQFSLVSVQREAAAEIEMLWNAVAEKNAEIERLRKPTPAYSLEIEGLVKYKHELENEIDRLRSALDKIYRITLAVNALKREPAA